MYDAGGGAVGRYTALFTGLWDLKKPGECPYLSMGAAGLERYAVAPTGHIAGTTLTVRPQEVIVDFNPDEAPQYLEGVEYPASKEEIISTAQDNGAPEGLIGMLGSLSRPEYSGPEQVADDLRAFPQSN